ncbi:unnamed protein product [Heterobilharzia americana]|nr:unnamed protein product [Heterobilharzia americana]
MPSAEMSMIGMSFASVKFKMLQDWSATNPSLMMGSELVEYVDHFTYLRSSISSNRLVAESSAQPVDIYKPASSVGLIGKISDNQSKDEYTALHSNLSSCG